MKICFSIKDQNYKYLSIDTLTLLSGKHWAYYYDRQVLSVFFVTEEEFAKYDEKDKIKEILDVDKSGYSPDIEYMGLFFPFNHEYGADVVLICPSRIEVVAKDFAISFDSLLRLVFLHELSHSLMCSNVFSRSEASLYLIPSFRFFEESLCNSFALKHFTCDDKSILEKFCQSQSPGYKDFYIWKEDKVNISIINFKDFKSKNHHLFNYLWLSRGKDILELDKSRCNSSRFGAGLFCFSDVELHSTVHAEEVKSKLLKEIIHNIAILKGINFIDVNAVSKQENIIIDFLKKLRFESIHKKSFCGMFVRKNENENENEDFIHLCCLNINRITTSYIERKVVSSLLNGGGVSFLSET